MIRLDRRSFLSSAAASVLSPAFLPFSDLRPAKAEDLPGRVDINTLVYPVYSLGNICSVKNSDPQGPLFAVFGTGPVGAEALLQLRSLWYEDPKWAACRAPRRTYEFVTEVAEASLRYEEQPEILGNPYIEDERRLHLAVVCCVFDDECAFRAAIKLAAVLTARDVPTVMIGKMTDSRSISIRELSIPPDINPDSLQDFRLVQIVEPLSSPSISGTDVRRETGFAIASAACIFVNLVWSPGWVRLSIHDLYEKLFPPNDCPLPPCDRIGWPEKVRNHLVERSDVTSRTDRYVLLSHTVPRHYGIEALGEMLHHSLHEWLWPGHLWHPVYVSIGSRLDTTLMEYDEMCWTIFEAYASSPDRGYIFHPRIHSGKPDTLSLEYIAVQLLETETTMV